MDLRKTNIVVCEGEIHNPKDDQTVNNAWHVFIWHSRSNFEHGEDDKPILSQNDYRRIVVH